MTADGNLVKVLVSVSEKAANIARICRQNERLLGLLVQEKKETEKNPRFLHDFKTLADVLVQEVVRYHLCQEFPDLTDCVYGEESNEFDCGDETLKIQVQKTESETRQLLCKALGGDMESSQVLAQVIHSDLNEGLDCFHLSRSTLPTNLGVWIDPIDSTGEYIIGKNGEGEGLVKSGLPCVTVLIGVFDKDTGQPIVGVVNQPFYQYENDQWSGKFVYGIHTDSVQMSSPTFDLSDPEKVIAVSSAESSELKSKLNQNGYATVELAGAGYKLLKIISGEVQAYILSKPTTFYWDTCAGHAILNAIGGGVLDFHTLMPLQYREGVGVSQCCNSGGILAYRNNEIKNHLVEILNI